MIVLDILDELHRRLNTDRPFNVPEVTLRRVSPEDKVTDDKIGIFLGDETLDPARGPGNVDPLRRCRRVLAVQCVGVTDDAADADRVTQPMVAWACKVLGRAKAPELGLLYVVETSTQHRVIPFDLYNVHTIVLFELNYQTRRDDLTTFT